MLLLQFSLLNIGPRSQALYIINDLVKKTTTKKKTKKKDCCFVVAAVLLQETMLDKENRPMWT